MKELHPERLDSLVLARLAVRAAKPPTPANVARSLYAFVARQLRQTEWQAAFSEALVRLREQRLIEENRLVLSPLGWAHLQAALRLRKAPRADSWVQFQKRYLPRLFLERLDSYGELAPNCAAVLLAERLGVPCDAETTPRQVVDAWLAHRLGIEGLSLEQLRNTLLARELSLPRRKRSADTLRLGIAHLSGAPSARSGPILVALGKRWLEAEAVPSATAASPPGGIAAGVDDELGRFADRVKAAADSARVRRYGENKVFISSVWQALSTDAEIGPLGEEGFKRQLIEAHRRGALVLARADLVGAMDPKDVRGSEIHHHNATYHFIHRGQPA